MGLYSVRELVGVVLVVVVVVVVVGGGGDRREDDGGAAPLYGGVPRQEADQTFMKG